MTEDKEKKLDDMIQMLTRSSIDTAASLLGIASLLVLKGVISKDELIGCLAGGKQGMEELCKSTGADAETLSYMFSKTRA